MFLIFHSSSVILNDTLFFPPKKILQKVKNTFISTFFFNILNLTQNNLIFFLQNLRNLSIGQMSNSNLYMFVYLKGLKKPKKQKT